MPVVQRVGAGRTSAAVEHSRYRGLAAEAVGACEHRYVDRIDRSRPVQDLWLQTASRATGILAGDPQVSII